MIFSSILTNKFNNFRREARRRNLCIFENSQRVFFFLIKIEVRVDLHLSTDLFKACKYVHLKFKLSKFIMKLNILLQFEYYGQNGHLISGNSRWQKSSDAERGQWPVALTTDLVIPSGSSRRLSRPLLFC